MAGASGERDGAYEAVRQAWLEGRPAEGTAIVVRQGLLAWTAVHPPAPAAPPNVAGAANGAVIAVQAVRSDLTGLLVSMLWNRRTKVSA